ncbi:MAG: hypothetical protein AAEJ04_08985, partial [Planctomycetota bacterium]
MSDTNPLIAALPPALQAMVINTLEHQGQMQLSCNAPNHRALLENFRNQQGFDYLVDVTAVD